MATHEIKIYGKTYQIKTTALETPAQELADFVDSRMQELSKTPAGKSSTIDLAILTALNIAREFFQYRKKSEESLEALEEKVGKLAERIKTELDRR